MTALKQAYRAELHRRRLVEIQRKLGRHDPLTVAQERRVREMQGVVIFD
jgi:hypothetical protein